MADNYVKNTAKDTPKSAVKVTPKKKTKQFDIKELWYRIRDYMTSVYNELKKVHWPDRKTLVAYTIVVLATVAVISGMLFLFDWVLGTLLDLLFKAVA